MSFTTLKNAVLSEKIDWLSYSQASKLDWSFPNYIDDHWKDISSIKFYTNGQENKQGVRRYWNTDNYQQGKLVILSGQPLDTIAEYRSDFLQWVHTTGKKATRIDYALDITHSDIRPETASKLLEIGSIRTHAQSALTIKDQLGSGYTQYIGRKGSETYTRIYDKAVEMGVPFKWIRVETVFQASRATPSLKAYCECQSTRPLIRSHVDFPTWADWQKLMSMPAAKLDIPKRETKTRAWLLSTVSRSIAKELNMDDDDEFWFQMIEAIKRELAFLGREW